MCEIPYTPELILQLIKCSSANTRCSLCKCLAISLSCMEMRECGVDKDQCDSMSSSGGLDRDDMDGDFAE